MSKRAELIDTGELNPDGTRKLVMRPLIDPTVMDEKLDLIIRRLEQVLKVMVGVEEPAEVKVDRPDPPAACTAAVRIEGGVKTVVFHTGGGTSGSLDAKQTKRLAKALADGGW